jgi:hypothetical protein
VLDGPVDAQELGVLAADPQDVRLAVEQDLEVVIRDAAAERLEVGPSARPDPLGDGLRCVRLSPLARRRVGLPEAPLRR